MEEAKTLNQDELAQERTHLAEERTGMANRRTDLAYERTALANEQTLLSYIRTAIGTFAAGIGMFEFVDNSAIVKIGVALMLITPVIMAVGAVHFFKVRKRISRHDGR